MNRINKKFIDLKKEGRKAFIAYITCGDPNLASTRRLIRELERCGADLIELGMPFSDPIADGPTIQKASARALRRGITLKDIFRLVRRIRRESDISLLLLTYYNPVFVFGTKEFVRRAVSCGIDGVIIPDLPPDEEKEFHRRARESGLALIYLLSPTTTRKRMEMIARRARGFIYYVSLTGVTGVRKELPGELTANLRAVRRLTSKPLAVGFGISRPEQIRALKAVSDGVIVGSAIVEIVERYGKSPLLIKKIRQFLIPLIKAVR